MRANPECAVCPIGAEDMALCSLADRLSNVYMRDALDTAPPDQWAQAEDEARQRGITPQDVGRLTARLEEDIDLSLMCFAALHERALQHREILAGLVDEQRVALAGCATQQLQGTCKNPA